MNAYTFEQEPITATSLNKLRKCAEPEDITIDIFCESMNEYLQKLNEASFGRYELDDYDMHVISIAMDHYVKLI